MLKQNTFPTNESLIEKERSEKLEEKNNGEWRRLDKMRPFNKCFSSTPDYELPTGYHKMGCRLIVRF